MCCGNGTVTEFHGLWYRLRGAHAYRADRHGVRWRGRVVGTAPEYGRVAVQRDDGVIQSCALHELCVHPETLRRPPDSITDELDGGPDGRGAA